MRRDCESKEKVSWMTGSAGYTHLVFTQSAANLFEVEHISCPTISHTYSTTDTSLSSSIFIAVAASEQRDQTLQLFVTSVCTIMGINSKALTFVNSVWSSFLKTSGMEPHLLGSLSIASVQPGHVKATMKIEPKHCNRLEILHGGVLACLVDTGGSLAVASRGLYSTGVSTDLQVTYIRSAGKIGETINCAFVCDSLGKTLAYTRVEFSNEKGQLVARGSHTKYVAIAQQHEKNIVEELRPAESQQISKTWTVPT